MITDAITFEFPGVTLQLSGNDGLQPLPMPMMPSCTTPSPEAVKLFNVAMQSSAQFDEKLPQTTQANATPTESKTAVLLTQLSSTKNFVHSVDVAEAVTASKTTIVVTEQSVVTQAVENASPQPVTLPLAAFDASSNIVKEEQLPLAQSRVSANVTQQPVQPESIVATTSAPQPQVAIKPLLASPQTPSPIAPAVVTSSTPPVINTIVVSAPTGSQPPLTVEGAVSKAMPPQTQSPVMPPPTTPVTDTTIASAPTISQPPSTAVEGAISMTVPQTQSPVMPPPTTPVTDTTIASVPTASQPSTAVEGAISKAMPQPQSPVKTDATMVSAPTGSQRQFVSADAPVTTIVQPSAVVESPASPILVTDAPLASASTTISQSPVVSEGSVVSDGNEVITKDGMTEESDAQNAIPMMQMAFTSPQSVAIPVETTRVSTTAEQFTSAQINEIADAVAEQIRVEPTLKTGEETVKIYLKPTVLGGSEISLSAKSGTLSVEITPATAQIAQRIQNAMPRLEAALVGHVAEFHSISVSLRKERRNETT